MSVLSVCVFAIASAGILALLRQLRPELAAVSGALAGTVILAYCISGFAPYVAELKGFVEESGAEGAFNLLIKALSMAVCCQFSADICRDCGENALAARVETAGKIGIIIISLPTVSELILIAKDLM